MEYGQRTVEITVNPYRCLDVITAIIVGRNLQDQVVKADAIITSNGPRMLFTENVIQIVTNPGNERAVRERCRLHELFVKRWPINLFQILVCGRHGRNVVQSQFFNQAALVGMKSALTSPSGLR